MYKNAIIYCLSKRIVSLSLSKAGLYMILSFLKLHRLRQAQADSIIIEALMAHKIKIIY